MKKLLVFLILCLPLFSQIHGVETLGSVSGVGGGSVGGASSLTTPGSLTYVVSSGVLGQDALFWDATNNYLYAGYVSAAEYQIRIGGTGSENLYISSGNLRIFHSGTTGYIRNFTGAGGLVIGDEYSTGPVQISPPGTVRVGPLNTTGTGTFHLYDATATTGVTTQKIKAGAGQASTELTQWLNNSDGVIASVQSGGTFTGPGIVDRTSTYYLRGDDMIINKDWRIRWSDNSTYIGTTDLVLKRAAAGVLDITAVATGETGAADYRDLRLNDLETVDSSNVGLESLANGALTSGTSWTRTGDMALASNAATYTHSAGSGTLVQASGTMLFAVRGSRWYKATYLVSGVTAGVSGTVTTAVAETAVALTLTAGTQTTYFRSKASPGDFTLGFTSTAGGVTLDDITLQEVSGGTVIARELIMSFSTEGSCNFASRGRVVFTPGATTVADTLRACTKDGADAYAWRALF